MNLKMIMYMNKDSEIKSIWKELSEAHVSGLIKRAVDIPSCLKMFCTYKSPDGLCGIAFSFNQEIKLDISPFSNLSEIEVSLFKDNSFPESKFLLIQLLERGNRVRDIFASICGNIASTIISISSEKEAIKLVISQMHKWQDLFSKKLKKSLSIQEQQGLYGELLFLQKLIYSPLDKVLSIKYWVGPNMAPQDFQSKFWAVEVKTVSVNKFPNISINGELQLDETTIEKLFLYNIVVEIDPIDGKSLPELVNEIRNSLCNAPNALNLFENKLIYYGYYDIDVDAYKERHYLIRKENYFLVQDLFPRIKKEDLLLGVSDVKYIITLAASNENLIKESNVLNIIQSYEGNQ